MCKLWPSTPPLVRYLVEHSVQVIQGADLHAQVPHDAVADAQVEEEVGKGKLGEVPLFGLELEGAPR